MNEKWIQGLEFLLNPEYEWPDRPDKPILSIAEDREVKSSAIIFLIQSDKKPDAMTQFVNHSSSLYKLKKAMA